MTEQQFNQPTTENKVLITIHITPEDAKALLRIRNHFGEDDRPSLEYLAYDVLDRIVSQCAYLEQPNP